MRPRRVLVLGSGATQIGQAGEFDYAGTQALKALRAARVQTVLINPNIASVQTSPDLADRIYFLPIDPFFVERVMTAEGVDAVLTGFGGQAALQCALDLEESGFLARHGVRVLGTPVEGIRDTEDRERFARRLAELGLGIPSSHRVCSLQEALGLLPRLGLPAMIRGSFGLGGQGSGIAKSEADFVRLVQAALLGSPHVVLEQSLEGWKEIELEVVRDACDQCVVVCGMENVDPVGIHTGDSIVVAPIQTLSDQEYQLLRDEAFRIVRHFGIVGACNVQFAVDPRTRGHRVIEVNARLSRSSALASKATGYPIAWVSAKVALGEPLHEIPLRAMATAFSEPALDYVVCKIPRWDLERFPGVEATPGARMKSIGEVMAIGGSFGEVLQKAIRMLDLGMDGLDPDACAGLSVLRAARSLLTGTDPDHVARLSGIDRFFLGEIGRLLAMRAAMAESGTEGLCASTLLAMKIAGFSDRTLARCLDLTEEQVRSLRVQMDVRPRLARVVDAPDGNAYFLSYAARACEFVGSSARKVLVLGSGCYRIGASLEFDWATVSAVHAARSLGYETILVNGNPGTVGTDHEVCDHLVFEEITLEAVLDLCSIVRPEGVLLSVGGQTPLRLAKALEEAGIRVFGTPAASIGRVEDRARFAALCDRLEISQPAWARVCAAEPLDDALTRLGGFPVLARPSYVLGGRSMRILSDRSSLETLLGSSDVPLLLTRFERAREIELDGVARRGAIRLAAVCEHLEAAGVHSGDSTLVFPPQDLSSEILARVLAIASRLAAELDVCGPFNLQLMLGDDGALRIIECNLRASRSMPLVSKALGVNFVAEAVHAILSDSPRPPDVPSIPLGVAVKVPRFSYHSLPGVDPLPGVEMTSTGEVACFGRDRDEALLLALRSAGYRWPAKGALVSGAWGEDAVLIEALRSAGIRTFKLSDGAHDGGLSAERASRLIASGDLDLVLDGVAAEPHGRLRRLASERALLVVSDLGLARRVAEALGRYRPEDLAVVAWDDYRAAATAERGNVNQKVLPLPSSLSNPI